MRVTVHVHPGASVTTVGGEHDGALVVRVRARAVAGAATRETLSAIAAAFGVKPSAVNLAHATRSRTKVVEVRGDEGDLADRLARLREGRGGAN